MQGKFLLRRGHVRRVIIMCLFAGEPIRMTVKKMFQGRVVTRPFIFNKTFFSSPRHKLVDNLSTISQFVFFVCIVWYKIKEANVKAWISPRLPNVSGLPCLGQSQILTLVTIVILGSFRMFKGTARNLWLGKGKKSLFWINNKIYGLAENPIPLCIVFSRSLTPSLKCVRFSACR